MAHYLYNARDIAAYFKWAGIPAHLEKDYLQFLFEKRDVLLARPLTSDYISFEHEVFRDMYYLWSLGFVNDYSDIALIAPEGAVSLFCGQEFITLESYMKLIALHLILSANLPYVRINFVGLPLLLGITGEYEDFENNLNRAFAALGLHASDIFGKSFDLGVGVPNELLCISLNKEYKESLFGEDGTGRRTGHNDKERMRALVEKSLKDKKIRDSENAIMKPHKDVQAESIHLKKHQIQGDSK